MNKLTRLRGSVYAHIGAKVALGKTVALEAIAKDEIELLLEKSLLIFNKYPQLYKATAWSSQVVGPDDYQSLFKFLRIGLQKYQADIQKEVDSWETQS